MDLGLRNRIVLVTGASSGIGAELATAFGREGARVALTYQSNPAAAQETAARVEAAGGQSLTVHYDLGDPASIDAAADNVAEEWGPVEVLVANAISWPERAPNGNRFEHLDPASWRAGLRDNIEGVFSTVQAVLPGMRRHGWGRILFISAGAAEEGLAGAETYTTVKSALHGLARSLAWDVGPDGVLVNVLAIGLTLTRRNARNVPEQVRDAIAARVPTRRLSRPDEVATPAVFLASAANTTVSGEVLHEGSACGRSSHAL